MTKPFNIGQGRSVVVRWRILAARRLDHLVELYQSGRWKLYYDEPEFVVLIQEARTALKTWETLAPPDPVFDKVAEVEIAQAADDVPATASIATGNVSIKYDLRKF